MKKTKQLKSYIMRSFLIVSVAIMLSSSVLDAALSQLIEMIRTNYHLVDNDLLSQIQPEAKHFVILVIVIYVALQFLVLWFFVRYFGKIINRRITGPIDNLSLGLNKIMEGELDTRLDFETENEFVDIRDSFNHMAKEIEKAQNQKVAFENERSALFSNLAHDLRTPITVIAGYSKSLADGVVDSREKERDYLNAIYAKSLQMNDMLDMLFAYAKLDNQHYTFKYQKEDIVELVRSNIAIAYTEFEHCNITLELELPDEAVFISMDSFEMNRALSNLLSNLIKHNPRGSSALLKVENAERLKIIIADNGSVIPECMVPSLFDPFIMGDESRNSKGGSGLGLAITKKIIEKHNGRIYLDPNYPGFKKAFIIEI